LTGHVVAVKARGADHTTSQLVIAFDMAMSAEGKQTPITGSIASIARAQGTTASSSGATSDLGIPSPSMGSPAPVAQSGHSGGAGVPAGGTDQKGGEKTTNSSAQFTLQQRDDGTVISSNDRDVVLDSGTQLLLKVVPQEKSN
jgi:hypothetical protein